MAAFHENSLEIVQDALENCDEMEIDGIEIDLVETTNCEFLLIHAASESLRLTGDPSIDLTTMSRATLLRTQTLQKTIPAATPYEPALSYKDRGTFTFLDTVLAMYSTKASDLTLILDIKNISSRGCTKLRSMINKHMPNQSKRVMFSCCDLFSCYLLGRNFPEFYKEWYPILDSYTIKPFWTERLYSNIVYYCVTKRWQGIAINMSAQLTWQTSFITDSMQLAYFAGPPPADSTPVYFLVDLVS